MIITLMKRFFQKKKRVNEYRPNRIKRSQVKILFTPVEYVIAGREIAEEE